MGRLTKEEQKRRAELLARGLKVCSKCGRVLPVEQFSKLKRSKDGLQSTCKECAQHYDKKYQQENKEKLQQYQQKYQPKYKQENKEKLQQYQQEYRQENKEKILQYYQENKEKIQEYYKQYCQTPQGQIVAFNGYAKRRKREELQGAGITKEQWLEMMQFFDFKCAYSGIYIGGEENKGIRSIDHIIPISKGGEHEVWNCVPMDRSLNSSKRDTDIMEWYTSQDFYSKERLDKIKAWQQYAYNKYGKQVEAQ